MSVVRVATRRRWATVGAGLAVLLAVPVATSSVVRAVDALSHRPSPAPRALVAAALRSDRIPFQGLAESRGSLGLPDLDGLGSLASLVGDTTRMRAWWASPQEWRVDTITATGETGTYGVGDRVLRWDYERRELTLAAAAPTVRLPRPDDVLAPELTRRLLSGLGSQDVVTGLGDLRVAGRLAHGVRIRPADRRSTVGRVDVWIDDSGLPLELRAFARDGTAALVSRFVELSLAGPAHSVLTPPSPPGVELVTEADFGIQRVLQEPGAGVLPRWLAGLPISSTALGGGATYGSGLIRLAVLPLPHRTADRLYDQARRAGAAAVPVPRGEAVLTTTTMLNAALARGADHEQAYLVSGLVTPELLEQAVTALVTDPVAEGTS